MPVPDRARAWLALLLAPGVGPRTLARLELKPGALAGLADRPARELKALGLKAETVSAIKNPDPEWLRAALDWLQPDHHHLITIADPLYPPLLRRISDPPPAMFVAGCPEVLVRPQVAVVGSRNATAGGLDNAREFSGALSRAGFVVTSGLAAGVDGVAHEAALAAGGLTVAVSGTGPDQVYPARHRDLARKIMDNGAVIATFPPGTGPRPGNFPARNRIISGMSLGVLVVEAGIQSGSLITARLAGEQGREVFAIPGSIHNPLARGCHRLLRQGARLTETADEIISELKPLTSELAGELEALLKPGEGQEASEVVDTGEHAPHINDPEYEQLLEAVGFDPTPVDVIIQRSELTTQAVSSMLMMLELDGRVIAHPGGRYSRTRPLRGP